MNILATIQPPTGEPELTCSYTGLLEPEAQNASGLLVARTVTPVTKGLTHVRVMNPTNDDCYVPCHTRLGVVHYLVSQKGEEYSMVEPTVAQVQTQVHPQSLPKVDLSVSFILTMS